MNLNISFGASVANAPAEFKTVVASVAQFFESSFSDPVTLNIQVEYGQLNGLLGHSNYELRGFSYSQITSRLAADAKSSDDVSVIANLPAQDPIQGTHHYVMTTAEAKALGLLGPSTALDGTATFASDASFDYDRSDGITPGQYDFFGSVAHEFSEIMGRELNAIGNKVQTGEANGYYPYDLFKYAAADTHVFVGTTPGYFSLDGGATNLDRFNTNPEDDFGDWAASAGNDSFLAFSSPGVVNAVTVTDLRVMDALGWDAHFSVPVASTGRGSVGGGNNAPSDLGLIAETVVGNVSDHAIARPTFIPADLHINDIAPIRPVITEVATFDWHLV